MVVVDPAYLPTHPAKGSRSTIAAVSLAASLLFGLLLAVGCALLDDRLYDAVDVESLGRLPLLVTVPRAGKSSRRSQHG
jgi:capsular polysaccharide biosynthesis protein